MADAAAHRGEAAPATALATAEQSPAPALHMAITPLCAHVGVSQVTGATASSLATRPASAWTS